MDKILENLIKRDVGKNAFPSKIIVFHSIKAVVLYSGIAIRGIRVLPFTLFSNISSKRKRYLKRYAWFKFFREKRIKTDEKVLVLHHIWSNGYHHWLCDCLLKIEHIRPSEYVLFIPESYPKFVFDSLSFFDFREIRKIPSGHALKGSNITFVSNIESGYYHLPSLRWLRETLIAKTGVAIASRKRKIYISRSSAGKRCIVNESEIIPVLEAHGFEITDTSKMSFRDQIELFSNTEVLLSNHGAGITNCLFMPEKSQVIELYRKMSSPGDQMNLCYYRLATTLNFKYDCLFVDLADNPEEPEADRKNIQVNPQELSEFLDRLFKIA